MNLFDTILPLAHAGSGRRQIFVLNMRIKFKWHSQLQPLDLDLLKDHVGTDKYFGMHYQPII